MATERQKKVAQKLSENVRVDKPKNQGEILKESGFSESTSEKPYRVIQSKGVQEELDPVVEMMRTERNAALELANEKRGSAAYRDLIAAADKLTKNIELLSGNPTERTETNEDLSALDKLAKKMEDDNLGDYEEVKEKAEETS